MILTQYISVKYLFKSSNRENKGIAIKLVKSMVLSPTQEGEIKS